jgi:hypothetical protein
MDDSFGAGERFIQAEARLLERRLFATCFQDAPPTGVIDALRGYQNDDGGFGHGLEPDKRVPASLPLDVEIAFQSLATAGAGATGAAAEMLQRACDFLGRTAAAAGAGGAVSLTFPVIEGYPRAAHMSDWTYEPGPNPTAGLAGLLHRIGFAHPWRDEATRYCWAVLDSGKLPDEVHALSELFGFLEWVPERERAENHAPAVLARLLASPMFHLDPAAEGYGLTPLQIAPAAGSRWRSLFTDQQIDGHLDHLAGAQLDDGGWPISWEPPGTASLQDWRGLVTLGALRTLTSYGRLKPTG